MTLLICVSDFIKLMYNLKNNKAMKRKRSNMDKKRSKRTKVGEMGASNRDFVETYNK